MKSFSIALAALLATTAGAANAASIGLSTNYSVDWIVGVDTLEGSAITYNWDTNQLYVVGDEAHWGRYSVVDGSNGASLPGISTFNDPEGIAYLGGDFFALAQERIMEINKISGSVFTPEASAPTFDIDGPGNVGNIGLEGISYDRRNGDFYGVKQQDPQKVWRVTGVDFAGNGTVTELFDASLLGLQTLSDISVLSNSDSFVGTVFEENLLILSASAQKLLEVSKTGDILSVLDLSAIGVGTIEGVTVDNDGNIFLIGEQGPIVAGGYQVSGLIKLERANVAAVPEPASWAMLIAGFAAVGTSMRRRRASVAFA